MKNNKVYAALLSLLLYATNATAEMQCYGGYMGNGEIRTGPTPASVLTPTWSAYWNGQWQKTVTYTLGRLLSDDAEWLIYEMNEHVTSIYGSSSEVSYVNPSCRKDTMISLTLAAAINEKPPRPAGAEGDGKSTYSMVAKLTEGGKPKAGMTVTFEVDVTDGSGGHPTAPNRPKGALSINSGKTDANGEVKVTFTAPVFAGTHKVTATCTDCKPSALIKDHSFDVKVPGLSLFGADTQTPARWSFIGVDRYHGVNRYYLTTDAKANLISLIDAIRAVRWALPGTTVKNQSWGQVGVNDASLIWGGRYPADNGAATLVAYPWTGNGFHAAHRLGVEVDLRISSQSEPNRKLVYEAICAIEEEDLAPTLLYHYKVGPHFHAYLLGGTVPKDKGGSDCWESPK